jgi:hypothetical protein
LWGANEYLGKQVRLAAIPVGGGDREQQLADRLGVPFLPIALGYAVTLLAGLGFIRSCRTNGITAFYLFGTLYAGALFLWVWNDVRLLFPILPHIQLGLLMGIHAMSGWVGRLGRDNSQTSRYRWLPVYGVSIALMAISAYKSLTIADSREHAGDIEARTRWIRLNTSPEAIVMSASPEIDFLYGGRKTVSYPGAASFEQLEEQVARYGVTHILIAPAIDWETAYRPRYDALTADLVELLADPAAEGRIGRVHDSGPDLIQVFEVRR